MTPEEAIAFLLSTGEESPGDYSDVASEVIEAEVTSDMFSLRRYETRGNPGRREHTEYSLNRVKTLQAHVALGQHELALRKRRMTALSIQIEGVFIVFIGSTGRAEMSMPNSTLERIDKHAQGFAQQQGCDAQQIRDFAGRACMVFRRKWGMNMV